MATYGHEGGGGFNADQRGDASIEPSSSSPTCSTADTERDAARYRWLRDNGIDGAKRIGEALIVYQGPDSDHSLLPDELDAAIDAAMRR